MDALRTAPPIEKGLNRYRCRQKTIGLGRRPISGKSQVNTITVHAVTADLTP